MMKSRDKELDFHLNTRKDKMAGPGTAAVLTSGSLFQRDQTGGESGC
jgi:hypothetical protein